MAENGDNNLETLRRHALLLDNVFNIITAEDFEEAAAIEYAEGYRMSTVRFVAAELSSALFADLPLSARSSDAILVAHIALLRDCGDPDRIGEAIDLFINSVALCNLGNGYFASGGNASVAHFVVEMLAAVAARKVVVPETHHAEWIVFDVLLDYIANEEEQDENVAGAVFALRDFCAVRENQECAARRGAVEALVRLLVRGLDDRGCGSACVREGALGALRFLLNHPAGRAAFAYESQSGHAVRSCVGTFSAIVTDAAMCCLSTVVVYFPLYYSFGLMQPPSLEHHQRNFSRSARSMVVSVQEVMETSLADHAPTEDDSLSTFE